MIRSAGSCCARPASDTDRAAIAGVIGNTRTALAATTSSRKDWQSVPGSSLPFLVEHGDFPKGDVAARESGLALCRLDRLPGLGCQALGRQRVEDQCAGIKKDHPVLSSGPRSATSRRRFGTLPVAPVVEPWPLTWGRAAVVPLHPQLSRGGEQAPPGSNPIWGACALVRAPRPQEDIRLRQARPAIFCRPSAPFTRIFGWRFRPSSVRERKSAMVFSALLLAVASYTEACAQTATAAFRAVDYEEVPAYPADLCAYLAGLIDANNKALASGFLHMKAAPGHNLSLVLNNAEIPIPGGKIVASIRSGLDGGCHIGSISQDGDSSRFFVSSSRNRLQERASTNERHRVHLPSWQHVSG